MRDEGGIASLLQAKPVCTKKHRIYIYAMTNNYPYPYPTVNIHIHTHTHTYTHTHAGLYGVAGSANATGDDQKKIDVLSDEMFVNALYVYTMLLCVIVWYIVCYCMVLYDIFCSFYIFCSDRDWLVVEERVGLLL